MKYSDRIKKTVDLMEPASCLADIGCDHGYMSILAVQNGLFHKVYAADISEGPLSRAMENIRSSEMEDRIIPVLSDGFDHIPGDACSAVICGMGGILIRNILQAAGNRLETFSQLILGPHSETEELRSWIIQDTCFDICRETALSEGGKHYILMDVQPGKKAGTSAFYKSASDLKFGTVSNQTDPASYGEYLRYLIHRSEKALFMCESGCSLRSEKRISELRSDIEALNNRINSLKENR